MTLLHTVRNKIGRAVKKFFNLDTVFHSDTMFAKRYHFVPRDIHCNSFSHGIHADNCLYNVGSALCQQKDHNSFPWRHFSAILYLNSADGGDLTFHNITSDLPLFVVPTRTGRLVLFSSGPENLHAVGRVHSGPRYAFLLWFTRQKEKYEDFFGGEEILPPDHEQFLQLHPHFREL